MSDMSVNMANLESSANSVNFGRRKHRNNRQKYQNNSTQSSPFLKMLEAGIAAGGGLYARKQLAAPTADEVVLQMHNSKLAKDYKEISVIDGIVAGLKKEGATFTDASKEALKKIGVEVPADKSPLEYLTDLLTTKREAAEAGDRGLMNRKLSALNVFEKAEKAVKDTPAEKTSSKLIEGLEGMKKAIAKMFHMTDDKGNITGEVNVKELKEQVETQSKTLSEKLIALKSSVADKIKDIKLLDMNDEVAKAYKAVSDSKKLKGYGAVAAAVLGAFAFLFTGSKNSSRKAA